MKFFSNSCDSNDSKYPTYKNEKSLNNRKVSTNAILEQMNLLSHVIQSQAALIEEVNASVEEINEMGEKVVEFLNQA